MTRSLARRLVVLAAVAVVLAGLGSLVRPAVGQGDPVFTPRSGLASVGGSWGEIVRARPVSINFPPLGSARVSGGTLNLNLFDDVTLEGVVTRTSPTASGGYVLEGHVAGYAVTDAWLTIVVNGDIVMGQVVTPTGRYHIRTPAPGASEVQQIDQSRFLDELEAEDEHGAHEEGPPATGNDSGATIDVLVVYTPLARQAAGGTQAIQSLIDLGVAETNAAYAASGVTPRIRLVHRAEVDYVESGDMSLDLTRLRGAGDGQLDTVHSLRDTYGADLVSLWGSYNPSSAGCGIAYLYNGSAAVGFSVVDVSCAVGNLSFPHELGHNQSALHDRYQVDCCEGGVAPGDSNYGYVNLGGRWRTILAYNTQCSRSGFNCTRVRYFSNPNGCYQNAPTGVAGQSDNRLAINTTAFAVANFRQQVVPDAGIQTVALPGGGSRLAVSGSTASAIPIVIRENAAVGCPGGW